MKLVGSTVTAKNLIQNGKSMSKVVGGAFTQAGAFIQRNTVLLHHMIMTQISPDEIMHTPPPNYGKSKSAFHCVER